MTTPADLIAVGSCARPQKGMSHFRPVELNGPDRLTNPERDLDQPVGSGWLAPNGG